MAKKKKAQRGNSSPVHPYQIPISKQFQEYPRKKITRTIHSDVQNPIQDDLFSIMILREKPLAHNPILDDLVSNMINSDNLQSQSPILGDSVSKMINSEKRRAINLNFYKTHMNPILKQFNQQISTTNPENLKFSVIPHKKITTERQFFLISLKMRQHPQIWESFYHFIDKNLQYLNQIPILDVIWKDKLTEKIRKISSFLNEMNNLEPPQFDLKKAFDFCFGKKLGKKEQRMFTLNSFNRNKAIKNQEKNIEESQEQNS